MVVFLKTGTPKSQFYKCFLVMQLKWIVLTCSNRCNNCKIKDAKCDKDTEDELHANPKITIFFGFLNVLRAQKCDWPSTRNDPQLDPKWRKNRSQITPKERKKKTRRDQSRLFFYTLDTDRFRATPIGKRSIRAGPWHKQDANEGPKTIEKHYENLKFRTSKPHAKRH